MLALAANNGDICTESWDVSTAFLYAPMEEEVYVEQPKRFLRNDKKDIVIKLNESLYRIKQATESFMTKFQRKLQSFAMARTAQLQDLKDWSRTRT